jgi:hypothetical protein
VPLVVEVLELPPVPPLPLVVEVELLLAPPVLSSSSSRPTSWLPLAQATPATQIASRRYRIKVT